MKTTTKQGHDLKPGDKLIRNDGQVLTIKRLSNGMARDSRIAEFNRSGDEWATIFNKTEYEVAAEVK